MRDVKSQLSGTIDVAGPVRTCVGCRGRDSDSRLLRIVFDPSESAISPDRRRRAGGRGAWVHRDERCITTALDRKAFARALRVTGTVSTDAVVELLGTMHPGHDVTRRPNGRQGEHKNRNGSDTMSTP